MSAAALPLTGIQPCQTGVSLRETPATRNLWLVATTAIVIGLAFFVTSHDMKVSLAVAYTQTAEEMEIAAAGGNTLRRVAFLIIGAWGCALFATSGQRLRTDLLLAGSLALLVGLVGASFLWADDPGMCLRRLFSLLCCVAAAVGIARALTLREISWMIVWMLGTLAVVGVLAELRLGTFRPWSGDYRFAGTVHPNTQGPGLATLCLAALGLASESSRSRAWLWIVFAAAFGLLVLTKSRTTTAAIVLAIGAVQVVKTPLATKFTAIFAFGWLAAAGLLAIWVCGFDPLTDFRDALLLGRAEESDTLSGRAFIWPEVLSFVSQRFWLGYGYESFWTAGRIDTISTNLGWGLREAHNAYLEILLSLGAMGLVVLLIVLGAGLAASVRGWRVTGQAVYMLPIGLIVFGLLNAFLESGMVAISLVPFLLGCCLLRLGLFREVAVGCMSAAKCTDGSSIAERCVSRTLQEKK